MALSSTDRWHILSNIVARKGTDSVDLYAELAKAESTVNMMDTQEAMGVSANITQTAPMPPVQEQVPPIA